MFPYSEIKLQLVCMPQIFVLYYGHYLSLFSVLLPSSRSQRCLNVVRYAFDKEFLRTARQYKETHETPKDQFWLNQFWQLPIYKRIMILGAGFYVIPHKISEYLRADFPSNVNMQIIRDFCNILNVSILCLTSILLHCNKHHLSMRNGPFHRLKYTESRANMGLIVP